MSLIAAAKNESALNEFSTADLLAYYNAKTGKATKKFSSRAAGIAQVWALVAAEQAELEEQTKILAGTPVLRGKKQSAARIEAAKIEIEARDKIETERTALVDAFNSITCPNCGETHDQTMAGEEGTTAGDERAFCHHCCTEYWLETGKIYKAPAQSEARAKSIAASWQDPEVRAARAARHKVVVENELYASLAKAFDALDISTKALIRVRQQLVLLGKVEYAGHIFKIAK